jgi:hypothetical protein
MHHSFEKQDSVHRKTTSSWLSLNTSLIEQLLCLSIVFTPCKIGVGVTDCSISLVCPTINLAPLSRLHKRNESYQNTQSLLGSRRPHREPTETRVSVEASYFSKELCISTAVSELALKFGSRHSSLAYTSPVASEIWLRFLGELSLQLLNHPFLGHNLAIYRPL